LLEEIKRDRDRRIQRSKKPRLDYNQARSMWNLEYYVNRQISMHMKDVVEYGTKGS
jgi:hypothetical protein